MTNHNKDTKRCPNCGNICEELTDINCCHECTNTLDEMANMFPEADELRNSLKENKPVIDELLEKARKRDEEEQRKNNDKQ